MVDPALINSLLIGKSFISEIYYFDELKSTNDYAKNNQLTDSSLIITNHQIGGRGRLDNNWQSEKNKNLTFTLLKRYEIAPASQTVLIYFFSLCLYSVINRYIGELEKEIYSLTIKWPNDILLNNKKIAGILIETQGRGGNYVIGMGINVNQLEFADEITDFATSILNETGKNVDLNLFLAEIIKEIQNSGQLLEYRKYVEIFDLWKNCNKYIGRKVSYVNKSDGQKEAFVEGFTLDGRIVLVSGGTKCSFLCGEIKLQL